jgi:hypothetical protein
MFCNRNEEMMVEKCRPGLVETKYGGAMSMLKQKRKPLPLRNEAQLNCVSLRSQLDCEVTGGAVKGQDERPFRAPLTAPPVTTGSIQHGRELAQGGLNTRKADKSGAAVGRPSCQSSLLSDPNAKFSAEMWRRPQKTRKVRWAATSALTFTTFS